MNKKRVMTFGTFDHFHAGHQYYLSQAKELGDELIVIIARDETVQKIKGHLPDNNEKARHAAVEASGIADKVVIGNKNDKYKVLTKYKPEVIALGYDQYAFTYRLKKFFIDSKMDATIVRLAAFKPSIYKSSLIRRAGVK